MCPDRHKCFLDFDGTLNEYKQRLYQFLLNNAPIDASKILSMEEFWNLKRMGIHEVDWFNSKFNLKIDKEKWTEAKIRDIEKKEYLKLDHLFDFTLVGLERLKRIYDIYIITKRNNIEGAREQIASYGIQKYLSGITILDHVSMTKAQVINKYYSVSEGDIVVGDTEDDITAGKELGIKTYFVLSGIRSSWIAQKVGANMDIEIVDDIREITST